MPRSPESFIEYVEHHERVWGTDNYPNRPSLSQILSAPVVVFWKDVDPKQPRLTITTHDELLDIERYITKLVFRATIDPPRQRLKRIFKDQKRVRIQGVKILFDEQAE